MRTRFPAFIAASLTLGLGALAGAPAALAAAPSVTPPSDCSGSINVYAYTRSALGSCGIATYPATVTDLPGGGEMYSYNSPDGIFAQTAIPPVGFDPETATAAQLTEYGYPQRPSDLTQLSQWERMVSIPRQTPEPFMAAGGPYSANSSSPNYAGYYSTAGGFTYAEAEYVEPYFPGDPSGCSGSTAVSWAGLGSSLSSSNNALFQDGTAHGTNVANHQPWWEIATRSGGGSITAFPQSGTTAYGDSILATVDTQSNPGHVIFTVYDYSSNKTWTTTKSNSGYTVGGSAEGIVERTSLQGSGTTPLSKFNPENFEYLAMGQTVAEGIQSWPYNGLYMQNGSDRLANISTVTNNSYTVTWAGNCK